MKNKFTTLLLIATTSCASAASKSEAVDISPTEAVSLEYSDTLVYDLAELPDDQFQPTFRFRHFGEKFADLSFRFYLSPDKENKIQKQGDVDNLLTKVARGYVDGSVEKKINIVRIPKKQGFAAYCIFTDADLIGIKEIRPGTYRKLIFGVIKDSDYIFILKGFLNEDHGASFDSLKEVVEKIKIQKK